VLEVLLDEELALADFTHNFGRMFGQETIEEVIGFAEGRLRFHGLFETDMQLTGIDKHLRLLESYRKLHRARAAASHQQG